MGAATETPAAVGAAPRYVNSPEELAKAHADAGDKLVVIDFTATWCGPCKVIGPKYDQISVDNPHIVCLKVDVDEGEEVAQAHDISSMPTFQLFKGGKKVGEMSGSEYHKLTALIETHGGKKLAAADGGGPSAAKRAHIQHDSALPRLPALPADGALRIMISGPTSGAGKSTVALGLMAALLKRGLPPSQLAYIKPATQGVQPTLTAKFCQTAGVEYQHIGPVVFYRGFTEAHVLDKAAPTSLLLARVARAVDKIGKGKSVVVIDGVGYPSVGSIVGVCNAQVAKTADASVLIVGKEGLGDAVDSYNLCASYFESRDVPVLGAVFNRLSAGVSARTREFVPKYFAKARPAQRVYGFLDEKLEFKANHDSYSAPGTSNACNVPKDNKVAEALRTVSPCSDVEFRLCELMATEFIASGVLVDELLSDARSVADKAAAAKAEAAGASANVMGMM
jgi:thioredoxin